MEDAPASVLAYWRTGALIPTAILGAFAAMLGVFFTPWLTTSDGVGYFVYLPSIFLDHDLNLTNNYLPFTQPVHYLNAAGEGMNQYGIGWALVAAPGWLAARALGFATASGSSPAEILGATVMTPILAFAGAVLGWLFLRGSLKDQVLRTKSSSQEIILASGAALSFLLFATNAFHYAALEPAMSHGASLALVLGFLFFFTRGAAGESGSLHRLGNFAAAGAALGLALLVRVDNLFFAAVPAVWFMTTMVAQLMDIQSSRDESNKYSRDVFRLVTQKVSEGLVLLAPAVIVFLPQLLVWGHQAGTLLAGPQTYLGQAPLDFTFPHLGDVLVSPRHGLISWFPIVAVGLVGFAAVGWKVLPRWLFAGLGVAFIAKILLVSGWWAWDGFTALGQRFLVPEMIVPAIGFGALWLHSLRWGRVALGVVLALGVVWMLGLEAIYGARMIPSSGPVSFGEMLRALAALPAKILPILGTFFGSRGEFLLPQ